MRKERTIIMLLSLAIVIGAIVSACTQTPTGNAVKLSQLTPDEDPATPAQDISMNIIIGTFEPSQITVKKGVPVRLSVTSKEIDPKFTSHGFSVKELGINENIPIGETKVIEFVPDKTGDFVFYCSQFCGQGHMGQTGIIHVIE